MFVSFVKLRIRESIRSSNYDKNLIISIIIALMMLYLTVSFLALGFSLDRILIKIFPGSNPVELFNRGLLYYFGFELLVRFFLQSSPAMSISPFLHLPVRRSFLMRFLLVRSIINPLNYISFLIFIPFAVRAVSPMYSDAAACWWLLTLFLLQLFVIYTNVYIKRQMVVKPAVSLGCGLAYIALIALDYFKIFSLAEFSSSLFGAALEQALWILLPVSLATGAYLLNYRFLITHSYPEEIDRRAKKKQVSAQNLGFMSRFGQIGELIGLELKLIFRHKRTKSTFYLAFILLFYGLMFYTNSLVKDNMMWLTLVGVLMTGLIMFQYGPFIIAWEGKFFDGILTRKSSLFDYFRAKYYLLASFCFASYILTSPYAFFGIKILWIQTACFLFNIGVNSYIMLWFAQYNRERMELSQGAAFNWQGSNASQYITILPIILLPILTVSVFKWLGLESWELGALAILGIAGMLCHKWIILGISLRFAQTKYTVAEGFRSNN